jgi:hypothetical protein
LKEVYATAKASAAFCRTDLLNTLKHFFVNNRRVFVFVNNEFLGGVLQSIFVFKRLLVSLKVDDVPEIFPPCENVYYSGVTPIARVKNLIALANPGVCGVDSGDFHLHFPQSVSNQFVMSAQEAKNRVMWEKYHGGPIPDNWFVIHLNGDKNDFSETNLCAVSKYVHIMMIAHEWYSNCPELTVVCIALCKLLETLRKSGVDVTEECKRLQKEYNHDMTGQLRYCSNEQLEWIAANCSKLSDKELLRQFNEKFNINHTLKQIQRVRRSNGVFVREVRRFTAEQIRWLRDNRARFRLKELAEEFNARFDDNRTRCDLNQVCFHKKIHKRVQQSVSEVS